MKTDRELLELAAKAAGHEFKFMTLPTGAEHPFIKVGDLWIDWFPLADDGDAIRLAVNLELDLNLGQCGTLVYMKRGTPTVEEYSDNYMSAFRRAIVRAAAAIGEGLAPFPTAEQIREDWT